MSTLLRQVAVLAGAQLKLRYRKTVGGAVWVLLNPMIQYGTQALVFSYILKLNITNYPLFLLGGLLPWIFCSQTVDMATTVYVQQSQFLRAFSADPRVFVFALVAENSFNLLVTMLSFLAAFSAFGRADFFSGLLALLCLPPLIIGVAGIAVISAALHVLFRDMKFVMNFAFTVGYFLTPIFYPIEFVPAHLRAILELNPIFQWIRPIRLAVTGSADAANAFLPNLLSSYVVALAVFGLGLFTWRMLKNKVRLYV